MFTDYVSCIFYAFYVECDIFFIFFSFVFFNSCIFPDLSDDFLLLLGASLQLQVFEEELKPSVQILAGNNCELDEDDEEVSSPIRQLTLNAVPDFMLCR